jgi:SAM-dependent methyltransferase
MLFLCHPPFARCVSPGRYNIHFDARRMILKSRWTRLARNWFLAFSNPQSLRGLLNLPRYIRDWKRYSQLSAHNAIRWSESYPRLTDWVPYTPFDSHYFFQACWAARKLAQSRPRWHVDVGSSITAIGVISAAVPTFFVDLRPLTVHIAGLSPLAGNLLQLPFASGSIYSLSCLHVVEHVGLGRYGDAIDPAGSTKAAEELTRVLVPGGRLLLTTPVGRERVQFNAHRVFAPKTVLAMFEKFELIDMALVDDDGRYHAAARIEQATDSEYACGMFELLKRRHDPS